MNTVAVEVGLCHLHLLLVNEAHVAETAVGELVHDGAAQVIGEGIVDKRADDGAHCGKENHQEDVQLAFLGCQIGSGGNHHFAGEGDETAFNGHQQGDDPIVEVFETPRNEGNTLHLIVFCVDV